MTIRNIDDTIKNPLRLRAAIHGRSMEDEARDIMRSALSTETPRPRNLGQAINERFGALGAVDLPDLPRDDDPAAGGLRRMIVLDTNVISELMRREPEPTVMAWMAGQLIEGVFTTTLKGGIRIRDDERGPEAHPSVGAGERPY